MMRWLSRKQEATAYLRMMLQKNYATSRVLQKKHCQKRATYSAIAVLPALVCAATSTLSPRSMQPTACC